MKGLARQLAGAVATPVATALACTWRIEILRPEAWELAVKGSGPAGLVLLCWHEALLPVIWAHRRYGMAAVVSEARDGEYLADFARRAGYRLVRGSSSRGGTRALRQAVRMLRNGTPVGFTPDGPRGPARELKPGAIGAAGLAGSMVLPVHATARPAWRASSWDRFLLPGPFADIRIAYGEPFAATPAARGADRDHLMSRCRQELERAERLAAWPDDAATATG